MIVDADGNPLRIGGQTVPHPGFVRDTFARSGNKIGNGWSDYSDDTEYLDPVELRDGWIGSGDSVTYGHLIIARDNPNGADGDTKGYEVSMVWDATHFTDQVSPMVAADSPANIDYRNEIGLCATPDVALGLPIYIVTAFHNPNTHNVDTADDDNYVKFDFQVPVMHEDDFFGGIDLSENISYDEYGSAILLGDPEVTITLRVKDNKLAAWFGDQRVLGPIDLPEWAQGRTASGLQIIQARNYPEIVSPYRHPVPRQDHVKSLTVKTWDGDLGDYPDAATVAGVTTPAQEASATSITVDVPTHTDGDLLYAIVASNRAGAVTSAGWQQVSSGGSNPKQVLLVRVADSEPASYDFAHAGSAGPLAATIVALSGANPSVFMSEWISGTERPGFWNTANGQANAADTDVTGRSANIIGPNRTVLWFAATLDGAVTVPDGFTEVANTGDTGDVRLTIGSKVFQPVQNGVVPAQQPTGELVGTSDAATASHVITMRVLPDPRES